MRNENPNSLNSVGSRQGKDKKKRDAKRLYQLLWQKPISRRMAATLLGYTDQTYMVTQMINDWMKAGKAEFVQIVKCERSGHLVQGITTNPDLFYKSNQLKLPIC